MTKELGITEIGRKRQAMMAAFAEHRRAEAELEAAKSSEYVTWMRYLMAVRTAGYCEGCACSGVHKIAKLCKEQHVWLAATG